MQPVHPLTAFRHCPRCGSLAGVVPSIKRYVCGVCGFEYYQNAAAAVIGLIRDRQGRVLFTRRDRDPARGKLGLPGGFVDPLETAEAALAREVEEEVGLRVDGARYLGSFPNRYDYAGVTYYSIDLVFLCEVTDLSPLAAREEVAEVLLRFPADVDAAEIAFDSARAALRALQAADAP